MQSCLQFIQAGALNDFLLPDEPEKVKGRGVKRALDLKKSKDSPGNSHPKHAANPASVSAPVKLDPKLPEALLHVPLSPDSASDEIRCRLIATVDADYSDPSAVIAEMSCCCSLLSSVL